MFGKYNKAFKVVILMTIFLISAILAGNPDCSSQRECEKDTRVSCAAPEIACCSGLQTGTDHKGNVYLFRVGSCSCCSRCEILQEDPPMMIAPMTSTSGTNLRNGKGIFFYSTTVGDQGKNSPFKTLKSKILTRSNIDV